MTKAGKSDLQNLLKLIVDAAEKRLSQLPPEEAEAKRKKIRQIASAAASGGRGKPSKPSRTRASRVSPQSRAKIS